MSFVYSSTQRGPLGFKRLAAKRDATKHPFITRTMARFRTKSHTLYFLGLVRALLTLNPNLIPKVKP